MLWYGIKLVQATWYQSIAEFPLVSVGVSYLPVPIGGVHHGAVRHRAAAERRTVFASRRREPISAVSTE